MYSDIHIGLPLGKIDELLSLRYGRGKAPRLSDGNCDDDHGERTNTKLRAQPYHQRQRSGKMKRY